MEAIKGKPTNSSLGIHDWVASKMPKVLETKPKLKLPPRSRKVAQLLFRECMRILAGFFLDLGFGSVSYAMKDSHRRGSRNISCLT